MATDRILAAVLSALLDARTREQVDVAAHRALLVLAGASALALLLVLWTYLPPRRPAGKRSLVADVPSGPVVTLSELMVRTHRPLPGAEPYAWRNRHRGVHRPRAPIACDKTTRELPKVGIP